MEHEHCSFTGPEEPVLDVSDIQGLVVPGFNKPHQLLLGLRLPDGAEIVRNAKRVLRSLVSDLADAHSTLANRRAFRKERLRTSMRYPDSAPSATFAGIAFSYSGLLRLTPSVLAIPSEAFRLGLAARSSLLGDPTDPKSEGHPTNWVVGAAGNDLHALVVIGGDDRREVTQRGLAIASQFNGGGVDVVYKEQGDVRSDLKGHEHFGFDDGVSQPGLRGRASNAPDDFITPRFIRADTQPEASLFAYPGQDLVWPGEFVLGYSCSSPDPLLPGITPPMMPDWTRNGSFLVFRRLRQDVAMFWNTMREQAAILAKMPGFSGIDDEYLAARIVGRWPSGAPVNRVPAKDDAMLGADQQCNNHFRFDSESHAVPLADGHNDQYDMAKADPAGVTCPWAAHIRKLNTRDSASDLGGRDSTSLRRVLRLGIPFGAPLADRYDNLGADPEHGNRGLLFLCAQASIESQFEFLISRWANDPSRPKMPGGHDLLIGQNANDSQRNRYLTIFGATLGQAQINISKEWVIPTGGGYFFVPSLSAIRNVIAAELDSSASAPW